MEILNRLDIQNFCMVNSFLHVYIQSQYSEKGDKSENEQGGKISE